MICLSTLIACMITITASSQPPDSLHVGVECVALKPYDKALAPQCDIYVYDKGDGPDTSIAFKINRADSQHPEYPVGSAIYLAVIESFYEDDLALEKPPIKLVVGKSYDLSLKKVTGSDGVHWTYHFEPIK